MRAPARRLALASGFALLVFVAARGQNTAVRELAPGVYFWQGDHVLKQPANCTWVIFKDYVLVIDANFPGPAREIIPQIRKTTPKPIRFLFDTHWHSDHSGGNGVYIQEGAAVDLFRAVRRRTSHQGPEGGNQARTGIHHFPRSTGL